jgi:riboflavin biosynthesis pyrimidine reductase
MESKRSRSLTVSEFAASGLSEGRVSRMQIVTLYEREEPEESILTPELRRLYGGDLSFPEAHGNRPYVIGNFVETIDGVVSFAIPGRSGGGEISGGSEEDRFVMGLLRSIADAVVVGSGTLHGDPGHVRIPAFIYPEANDLYAELRRKLGKPPLPLNVILTASGKINFDEATFHSDGLPTAIVTTDEGAARIASDHGDMPHVTVRTTGEAGRTSPEAVLKILGRDFGVRLLVHEGGPTIFGQYLAAGMIDELFLTVAPQIAGRLHLAQRPGIAGETLFLPETAPWFGLRSIKRARDHLLLRYAALQGHREDR